MSEKTTENDNKKATGDLLDILYSVFGEDQPAVAVEKITRLLDSASDFAIYLADGFAQKSEDETTPSPINGKGLLHTVHIILNCALNEPEKLAEHYSQFAAAVLEAVNQQSDLEPQKSDRRFKDLLWRDSQFYRSLMQIYLAWNQHMQAWIEEQEIDEDDLRRVQFFLEQLSAAFSPSNLPIHPGALKRAEKSNGLSAVKGLRNWINDIQSNNGMPRQINENAYTVGVDLAITPGQVVFRNNLLELIQFAPQTEMVHRRPILLIPAQINKYYVFDLKPKNSFIRHATKAGFQVFALSWCNSKEMSPEWGLDTYIKAILEAIDVIRTITNYRTLNIMSVCAGGLTSLALLGYLAETKNLIVRSHSLFVTAVLTNNGSILELLTTPSMFELARTHTQNEGTMDGKALAQIFAWLRPVDLVWNYWVNNNLMGREPPPLDVLYWDNDPTRLPAALHSDLLDMYSNAVFEKPHSQSILGVPIDYSNVRVNTYFTAGTDDYLMPWPAIYRGACFFRGNHRFILSDSGHVQSVLRPPNLSRTMFYTNHELPESADDWLAAAERYDGTWWYDWYEWLAQNSGTLKRAPQQMGSHEFPTIMNAPGEYALQRI